MKLGIQYLEELQTEDAKEVGFSYFEVRYEDCGKIPAEQVAGMVLRVDGLTGEIFRDALMKAKTYSADYMVLDTQGVEEATELYEIVEHNIDKINENSIALYIENGYKYVNGLYCNSEFSEAGRLKDIVDKFNQICGGECFGICLNVGYANLVSKNVKVMVNELAGYLKMLHASDNDGRTNQHQLPCTFTTGRSVPSTNWYGIIGSLIKNQFDGWIIFDVPGFIRRTPNRLQKSMLKLVWDMGREWNRQFLLEEVLNQPEKTIILFGAGKMAQNYMESWGEKYPPAFLVDNNSKAWGMEAYGFEIKSPNSILEIPEQERSVWICNQYYDAVGKQLRDMGIEYQCYWDLYYL